MTLALPPIAKSAGSEVAIAIIHLSGGAAAVLHVPCFTGEHCDSQAESPDLQSFHNVNPAFLAFIVGPGARPYSGGPFAAQPRRRSGSVAVLQGWRSVRHARAEVRHCLNYEAAPAHSAGHCRIVPLVHPTEIGKASLLARSSGARSPLRPNFTRVREIFHPSAVRTRSRKYQPTFHSSVLVEMKA